MQKHPKIAFFGTPELVLPILAHLESSGILPAVIVTGEDMPHGRKMLIQKPAPKEWAEARNILVLQPKKIDAEFMEAFGKHGIELGVIVAYGKILPQALLDMPKLGMINVHYSLLPKYRGATPVEAAILSGDKETGVSIQKMAFKLDSGDVLGDARTEIGEKETAPELRARLNEIAKELLVETIAKIADGSAAGKRQDEAAATRCGKIRKEDGRIDPAGEAVQNWRKFKAHAGWPGTYFFVEKNEKKIRIIVKEADYVDGEFKMLKVVPEGRKEISYEEFLRN